jgi:hypothetical protein
MADADELSRDLDALALGDERAADEIARKALTLPESEYAGAFRRAYNVESINHDELLPDTVVRSYVVQRVHGFSQANFGPSCFSLLPNELIFEILCFASADGRTIMNFGCTSKRGYAIALETLQRHRLIMEMDMLDSRGVGVIPRPMPPVPDIIPDQRLDPRGGMGIGRGLAVSERGLFGRLKVLRFVPHDSRPSPIGERDVMLPRRTLPISRAGALRLRPMYPAMRGTVARQLKSEDFYMFSHALELDTIEFGVILPPEDVVDIFKDPERVVIRHLKIEFNVNGLVGKRVDYFTGYTFLETLRIGGDSAGVPGAAQLPNLYSREKVAAIINMWHASPRLNTLILEDNTVDADQIACSAIENCLNLTTVVLRGCRHSDKHIYLDALRARQAGLAGATQITTLLVTGWIPLLGSERATVGDPLEAFLANIPTHL